ncbi:protein kinase 4-like, partial [Bactrocera neohumeralis]|uniref:protein kinase 4-like n=1 Tax=Bactrocera neohumeralis TaxID=98809 RepID=UPI0021662FF7
TSGCPLFPPVVAPCSLKFLPNNFIKIICPRLHRRHRIICNSSSNNKQTSININISNKNDITATPAATTATSAQQHNYSHHYAALQQQQQHHTQHTIANSSNSNNNSCTITQMSGGSTCRTSHTHCRTPAPAACTEHHYHHQQQQQQQKQQQQSKNANQQQFQQHYGMMNGIGNQMVNGVSGGAVGVGGSKTAQQNATMPANSHQQQHYVGNAGDMNGSAYHQYMQSKWRHDEWRWRFVAVVCRIRTASTSIITHMHMPPVLLGQQNGAASNNSSFLLGNNNNCNNNGMRGNALRDASTGSGGHMLGGAGVGIGVSVGVGGVGVSTSAGSGVVSGAATLPYKNNGLNKQLPLQRTHQYGNRYTYQPNNSIAKSKCLHNCISFSQVVLKP